MRSSGTTGVPKLGVLTNEAALKRLEPHGVDLPSGPGCRFLSMININFHGVKQRFLHCLAAGGCFAIFEGERSRALVNFVTRHRVNYVSCIPNHAAILLKIAKKDRLLLPGLDAFRVGATVVPEGLRKEIQQRLTPNLFVGYGSNEAGAIAMASPALVKTIPDVVGKVVPGMTVEIVGEDGTPLPPGKMGTVRLKSEGMISGYVDAPEETAQAFRDGWFYPGDLAEFTGDGVLVHRGRADDIMIFNGINISPVEIENMLLRHPAVAEVAAFPVHTVADGAVPVSAIVTKKPVSKDELISYARSALGAHRPRHIMLVSELPRNTIGKILKPKLVEEFLRRYRKS